MTIRQLVIGAVLLLVPCGQAAADETERTFTAIGLTAETRSLTDFPPANEVRSGSVNDLVALLDRVRETRREPRLAFRARTLDQMVHERAWRKSVAYELARRFP